MHCTLVNACGGSADGRQSSGIRNRTSSRGARPAPRFHTFSRRGRAANALILGLVACRARPTDAAHHRSTGGAVHAAGPAGCDSLRPDRRWPPAVDGSASRAPRAESVRKRGRPRRESTSVTACATPNGARPTCGTLRETLSRAALESSQALKQSSPPHGVGASRPSERRLREARKAASRLVPGL